MRHLTRWLSVALAALALAAPPARAATRPLAGSPVYFRAQLGELLERYEGVFLRLDSGVGRTRIAQARAALASVSDADLARVFGRTGFPDLTPAVVAAEGLLAMTPARPAPGTKQFYAGRVQRAYDLPGAGAILSDCGNIQHDSSWNYGALIAWEVARGILSAAQFGCEEVVVVLGEGGNGAAVCIPLAIAADAAAIPFELGSFCAGEEDSAKLQGTYDRVAAVYTELQQIRNDIVQDAAANRDTLLAAIGQSRDAVVANANQNKAEIVQNSNQNRSLIIVNDDANRDAILANANGNRELLVKEIRALSCELARLVTTPQGQRASSIPACADQPGFPYSWNK